MSKTLSCLENLLIFVSVVSGCVLISWFASFVGVPVGIMSSAAVLKIYAITPGIKKYKSVIKEKRKKI